MKKALVTGGNRGIGKAIVEKLSESHEVYFTFKSGEKSAADVCSAISQKGGKARAFRLDLNNAEETQSIIAAEVKASGGFDVVVHNAGAASDTPLYFMDESTWRGVIDLSLNSFFYINKACLPKMITQRWGRIIVMASISGEAGNRGQTNYAAAKGALIAGAKSLSREVASRGIMVNVVSPGLIDTDMIKDIQMKDEIIKLIPSGRVGNPEEVASVVSFLASDGASYISGEVIRVNGGLYT